jgi:hypothetical protein
MAQGKDFSYEGIAKEKPVELPWLGQVPSYMQTYAEAKESGMGPLASTLMTVGTVAGDVSMTASLGEAAAGAFRPRAKLAQGETLQNVAPIKQAIVPVEGGGIKGITQPAGSVSEYYTIPKSVAKDQFGGSTNNTFLKMTPAGADSIELSVVHVRRGAIPKTVVYI